MPNFAPRAAQQAMARAVAEAIDQREALVSGKRVIISTGTKALQDQLFFRDLPRVRSVLDALLMVSLLKGRANYLCLHWS